jgi:NADH-quinone oxidoreductase subunit J
MPITEILFWALSTAAILAALMVIFSKNPVHSVLWLIVVFFAISGHYVLLNAQFLAIVNMIVYAGAIMVLFLFVIMLMNMNADQEPNKSKWMKMAGVVSGGSLMLLLVATLKNSTAVAGGRTLFNEYVVPFEISSVLFLSAMVGAIILGKKEKNIIETNVPKI